MTAIADKILAYMRNEYKNRLVNNPKMSDDSARMFSIDEICEACNLEHSTVAKETSNLKQYGCVQKWITGTIVLEED